MPSYLATIPIAGYLQVEVDGDETGIESEEEAIAYAIDNATLEDIAEWSTYERIVQGNVLYAPVNEIEVEVLEDYADD